MPPLRLTDDELNAVLDAASPLPVYVRDSFLRHVANELASCNGEVGPGTVGRVVRELQRRYRQAPNLAHDHSKYR